MKIFEIEPECFCAPFNTFRSSDGVCTAGTVVVSRLKMGEMEEADHIATDTSSQKVKQTINQRCQTFGPGAICSSWTDVTPHLRFKNCPYFCPPVQVIDADGDFFLKLGQNYFSQITIY